ncbi:MAG TPA: M4 family metallopeptidase [Nitrospira sp.]|nr:M4 family metallopeptidase [Nitrospira sp.]
MQIDQRTHSPECPTLCSIIPPHIFDQLTKSDDSKVRQLAIDAIAAGSAARAVRSTLSMMAGWAAVPSPSAKCHRLVYDVKHGNFNDLPGTLMREERDPRSDDPAVNEAYTHSGTTYNFYKKVFQRNSLDDRGMSLISSVHLGRNLNNAFWTGEQMCYGDGDSRIFIRFTKSLDVVGHELSHGVISHTCNLVYANEPGALNEHFADVFGSLVKQWRRRQSVKSADWMIGNDIMGPATTAKCLRTFKAEKAYENDPLLGTDPQPKHLRDKYNGSSDNGGVHINSGIPNHAFYLVANEIGGKAWERTGRIWYKTLLKLTSTSRFSDMVESSTETASTLYGAGSTEHKALVKAWKAVGF